MPAPGGGADAPKFTSTRLLQNRKKPQPMTKESQIYDELRQLKSKAADSERIIKQLEMETVNKCAQALARCNRMTAAAAKIEENLLVVIGQKDKENADLKEQLANALLQLENSEVEESEDPSLVKAKTVAIFDSILFAIENWSTDGDTAPDFSLACQSILFPLVYNQVMNGNEHYFLKTVPTASIEVVKRGREYVKFIRSTCQVGLTDPEAWSVHVPMIAKWWVNDALPLLYGARDDVWERSSPLSLEAITSWRDKPANRALEFPLVFDAMDLLDRFGDEIREKTNLPQFTRDTLNTRLEAN